MKDFKQNTKMACEGSHYQKGGKVKKYADGKSVVNEHNDLLNRNPSFTIGPNDTVVKNPKYKPEPTSDLMNRNPSFTIGPNGTLVKNPNYKPEPDPRMLNDLPTRNFPSKYKSGGKAKRGNKK
jgi:hypothetical protein